MWNFHVDDLQGNIKHDIMLRQMFLSKIKIDLCFSNYTIMVYGGAYEVWNAPIKDSSKINFNASSDWLTEKMFWDE